MVFTESGMIMVDSVDKPVHKQLGITLTFSPKEKLVIFVQPENAGFMYQPADKQLSALNTTDAIPLQFLKAPSPIESTECGISTDVIFDNSEHKKDGITLTLLPKVKLLILTQPAKALNSLADPAEVQLSALNTTDVKPLQFSKAQSPIEFTEVGIVMAVKPTQPLKAQPPMINTELGMVTDVRPLQSLNEPL